jgi:hypothetical protein
LSGDFVEQASMLLHKFKECFFSWMAKRCAYSWHEAAVCLCVMKDAHEVCMGDLVLL